MVRAFGILLGFHATGTLIAGLTGLPVPGNVLGLVLLTAALLLGWIRVEWIESAADLLVDNLAFLFVPAGVGVMSYFDLIARAWLPISISMVVSLVLVLIVTGKGCELAARAFGGGRGKNGD